MWHLAECQQFIQTGRLVDECSQLGAVNLYSDGICYLTDNLDGPPVPAGFYDGIVAGSKNYILPNAFGRTITVEGVFRT